jgi:hypothetical protein
VARQTKEKSEGECLCSFNEVIKEESNSDFATQKLERNSMECVLMMWIEKTEYMRI